MEPTQLAFVILGASMAAIGLMILVSSFLATGATRVEVRATDTYWRSQDFCYCPFILIVSFDSHIDPLTIPGLPESCWPSGWPRGDCSVHLPGLHPAGGLDGGALLLHHCHHLLLSQLG